MGYYGEKQSGELSGFDSVRPERSSWDQQEKPASEKNVVEGTGLNENVVKEIREVFEYFMHFSNGNSELARIMLLAYAMRVGNWDSISACYCPNLMDGEIVNLPYKS